MRISFDTMAVDQEVNIKFVQEVEKHDCLYKHSLPDYMLGKKIDRIWTEIGNKFKLTGPRARKKWIKLRNDFVRHLQPPKIGLAAHKDPYYLSEYMQFLIQFINIAGMPSGNLKESSIDVFHIEPDHKQLIKSKPTDTPLILRQESSIPSTSTPSIFELTTSNKRKIANVKKTQSEQDIAAYLNTKRSKLIENCDSSELFLLSLVSDMDKMNDKQKRLFKSRVLGLIDDVMSQNSTYNYRIL